MDPTVCPCPSLPIFNGLGICPCGLTGGLATFVVMGVIWLGVFFLKKRFW